jgi:hypothetical protein
MNAYCPLMSGATERTGDFIFKHGAALAEVSSSLPSPSKDSCFPDEPDRQDGIQRGQGSFRGMATNMALPILPSLTPPRF